MKRHAVSLAALPLALLAAACTPPAAPRNPQGGSGGASDANPLGASYVLVPLPSEDDSILGRILPEPPAPGRSLEETARANPCADKLSEPRTSPTANSFEDAQDLTVQGKARAMLGAFGFSGDAERATHFVYKLETSKRVSRQDTAEYNACCAEKGCGYGYVSALVYGEGEYATGEEASGSAQVDVMSVGSAAGGARVKVLHKRKVKGWLAAVVTVTDPKKGEALGALGVAHAAGITEAGVPETVKKLYDREKLDVKTTGGSFVFTTDKDGPMGENEFVRRYRAVTGASDLDDVETRRNKVSFYTAGALTGASALMGIYGFLTLSRACSASDVRTNSASDAFVPTDCQPRDARGDLLTTGGSELFDRSRDTTNSASVIMAGAGVVGTVGFGIWFLAAAFKGDGSATEHLLTEHDAVLYANRYNRALLRRTITDVQKTTSEAPRLHLAPMLGLGSVGLTGRF